ncbi:unnamed protein product [Cuscuta campestris]|uniref:Knottin scorpion toxin-like domain-containing protein n=1 Tax=Cuscuta campestris TaxID=132261 RepID=A0A484LEI0_9ASTE|nr:unnamed protein product [Cuscuta campestris]
MAKKISSLSAYATAIVALTLLVGLVMIPAASDAAECQNRVPNPNPAWKDCQNTCTQLYGSDFKARNTNTGNMECGCTTCP